MTMFTDPERMKLAQKGIAEPDGSFPIRDATDLAHAIRAYGRSKDPTRTRAHIVKRAGELGLGRMVPPHW